MNQHQAVFKAGSVVHFVTALYTLLRDHPRLGRARPEIHEEARSLVIERWLALYRMTDNGVQIVRVIDGARDLAAIEWTPE